ncbi:MAG: peptidoglycan-binding protein [Candidatus Vogelbacteria bacterium]|nr:peptidoglycan-binding protein [Candidatus Vogelbacteria bacterium]
MSNFKKTRMMKITASLVGVATSVLMLGGVAVLPALAETSAELQAKIDALLASVKTLQGQLGATSLAPATVAAPSYTFSANLSSGSMGPDVMALQKALNASADTQVSASGAGSPGNETSYFGPATKKAVIKYQNKYAADILTPIGLTSGTGNVGPATRVKLNAMGSVVAPVVTTPATTLPAGCTSAAGFSPTTGQSCGTAVVTTPAVTTTPAAAGSLAVSAPADIQPVNGSLAPMSAARVPATKIVLTAGASDVTVNSITVERTGVSSDASFSGVNLVDENGNLVGLEKTLNSDHKAVLTPSLVIKAGESRTLTVAATRGSATGHNSEEAYFQVDAIDAGAATLSGSAFPLKGSYMRVNDTLTIGSVTMADGSSNPSAQSKPVGTTSYIFSAIKVSAGSQEKVYLKSIRWYQSGSAGTADLANIKTYVDGVAYDTTASSDGKYYTSNFGNGLLIDKGGNKEVHVSGDILSGSGRTIEFDVYRNTDLSVYGATYGNYIVPPTTAVGSFAATNPWFTGKIATVQSGTITVSKSTSVPGQNIAVNLANQPLGGFDVEVKGEPISVTSMTFRLANWLGTSATASTQDVTDVKLVDSTGKVVAGPVDITATSPVVTFSDTVTFPIGKGTYTLKGKIGTDFATNQTIAASTTPSSDWTSTGQNTGNSITETPASAVTGNTMTVKAAAVTITVSPDPALQTVVAGAQDFTFANYQFDASQSGEDVKFTTVKGILTFGTALTADSLTACKLWDGATALTTGSNEVNPANADTTPVTKTFTFDNGNFVVGKGTVKTLTLKCNISASTGTGQVYNWGLPVNTSQSTGTGLTSSQTVTPTTLAANVGQVMTITTAGSLTVSLDGSSPAYSIAAAGTSGNLLAVFKLHATNEAISLQKFAMQLSNTASSTSSDLTSMGTNGAQVTLWDSAGNKVGSATFTGGNTFATSTLSADFIIPKDGDKLLYVKGDLSAIGSSAVIKNSGDLIALDNDGGDAANGGTQGKGTSSGTIINSGSTSDTTVISSGGGLRVMKSYPSITMITPPSGLGAGKLLRFKITANGAGDISLYKFAVRIATSSTATVTSVNAAAYNNADFTGPTSGMGTNGAFLSSNLSSLVTGSTAGTANAIFTTQNSSGATSTLVIPAGASKWIEVTGSIAYSSTGNTINTFLEGDANYHAQIPLSSTVPGLANAVAVYDNTASRGNDFIWSPNSTTTPNTTGDNDWTNGYNVPGLSAIESASTQLSN